MEHTHDAKKLEEAAQEIQRLRELFDRTSAEKYDFAHKYGQLIGKDADTLIEEQREEFDRRRDAMHRRRT